MAIEDGTTIANLLGHYQSSKSRSQPYRSLPEILKAYESLHKHRTASSTPRSIANQRVLSSSRRPKREDHDRILKQAKFEELPDGLLEPFLWIGLR